MSSINSRISGFINSRLGAVTGKDLVKGLLVVGAAACLTAATNLIILGRMTLPPEAAGLVGPISILSSLITVILGFAISVGIYHGVSTLMGGAGDLKRMFALIGFANFPILIQQGIRVVYYYVVNNPADLAPSPNGGVLKTILQNFNLFSFLYLILAVYAVRENYKLKGWKPVVVALIPVLITIAIGLVMRPVIPAQTL